MSERLYPVYIHKDEGSAYGVTIPDLPGCFTAGDTLEEALANIQEAVELHLDDTDTAPEPGDLEAYFNDPDYTGGTWVLAHIDMSFLNRRRVRVNITLTGAMLSRIDAAAAKRGLSRSGFLVLAAEGAMREGCGA